MTAHNGQATDPATEAKVKQCFGDRLVPCAASALAGRRPLPRTHAFLTRLGLPRDAPLLVTFYAGDELLQPLTLRGETHWVVGDDYGTKIVVGFEEDVWSADPEDRLPRRFINVNLAHFVLFLGFYEEAQCQSLRKANDDESVRIVSELRAKFNERDRLALADEESWWSVVLEKTQQGLL